MNIFEVCLTNYCNFKCTYCISDHTRGCDKFSQPLKLNEDGTLKLHSPGLTNEEIKKRDNILKKEGQLALDEYVKSEQEKWEATKEEKHDYGDWLDTESLLKFIRSNLDDTWLINLTGGEPLYYPKIEDFILELTKTHKVLLTTNLSLVRSKPKLLEISRNSLFFRVGYHPEFRNVDTFVECMKYLVDNNFKYLINYVAHPEYYEESEKYKEHLRLLKDNKFTYEVTPFEGKWNNTSYPRTVGNRTELEKKMFNINQRFEAIESKMGTNFLICEPSGKIYECQGRQEQLGDVYSGELSFKKIYHSMCFMTKGCPTLKSANMYLKVFLNTSI